MSSRSVHLREISELLRSWNGERQLLIGAANEYWAASLDAEAWSEPFDAWHERICSLILSNGGIRATIEAMDDDTARVTATELARFSEEGRRELPPRFMTPASAPPSISARWRALVPRAPETTAPPA
jgi:hypothetical protein